MVLKHFVLSVFLGIFVFAGYLTWHLGFFRDVEVREVQNVEYWLVGQEHIGPYHLIGPKITAVEDWARSQKIECEKSFGWYHDDPNITTHERLKSIGGCVLNNAEVERVKSATLAENFYLYRWAAEKAVSAKFTGAPSISPYKVYPKIEDYAKDKRLSLKTETLEIYSQNESEWQASYYRQIEVPQEETTQGSDQRSSQ